MRDIFRTILISLVVSVAVLFGLGEAMLKLQAGPPAHWQVAEPTPSVAPVGPDAAKPSDEMFTPNLVGVTVAEARERWQPLGIAVVEYSHREVETQAPGVILEQIPSAGAFLREDKEIRVVVARGRPKVEVPSFVGKTEAQANEAAKELGLVASDPIYELSTGEDGVVLRQDPAAGVSVIAGTEVSFAVAQKAVVMPKIYGKRLSQAKSMLAGLGLQVGQVTSREHPEMSGGRVMDQSIAAGTPVASGTAIDLVVVAPD